MSYSKDTTKTWCNLEVEMGKFYALAQITSGPGHLAYFMLYIVRIVIEFWLYPSHLRVYFLGILCQTSSIGYILLYYRFAWVFNYAYTGGDVYV